MKPERLASPRGARIEASAKGLAFLSIFYVFFNNMYYLLRIKYFSFMGVYLLFY